MPPDWVLYRLVLHIGKVFHRTVRGLPILTEKPPACQARIFARTPYGVIRSGLRSARRFRSTAPAPRCARRRPIQRSPPRTATGALRSDPAGESLCCASPAKRCTWYHPAPHAPKRSFRSTSAPQRHPCCYMEVRRISAVMGTARSFGSHGSLNSPISSAAFPRTAAVRADIIACIVNRNSLSNPFFACCTAILCKARPACFGATEMKIQPISLFDIFLSEKDNKTAIPTLNFFPFRATMNTVKEKHAIKSGASVSTKTAL